MRKKRRALEMEDNVNITALMDVLTVLLFFLIKSFSVSASTLTPPKGVTLPRSDAQSEVNEAVKVSLSAFELRADQKVLVKLRNGVLPRSSIGKDGRTIAALDRYLKTQKKKKQKVTQGQALPGKIIIQADQKLKFKTLKYLFHTVSQSGYSDYQFAIQKKQ